MRSTGSSRKGDGGGGLALSRRRAERDNELPIVLCLGKLGRMSQGGKNAWGKENIC